MLRRVALRVLDVLDDNASDCRLGVPPRQPGLFTVHPSVFDPSLCPPGKEATFCEQIAPYELRDGGSAAGGAQGGVRGRGARPLASVPRERLEPEAIVGRYISSPIDIERVMPSMRNGDWNHGEMSQDQLGVFRPFHEYPPYRTGFSNVYPCGPRRTWADRSAARADTTRRRSSPRTKGSTCGGKAEQSSRAALKAPLRVDRYGNVHRS